MFQLWNEKHKRDLKEQFSWFYCVIFNMYIMKSAVYVLQIFCFILLHFDILLSAAMKATEWKHFWKIFVREMRSARNLDSIFKFLFICTTRKTESNLHLIDY